MQIKLDHVPSTHDKGAYGEKIAENYLLSRGYEILDKNWRCRFGEVDIVALDDDETVLVEVKMRIAKEPRRGPYPEEAVGYRKRERYRLMCRRYLAEHPDAQVRFDVVAILVYEGQRASLRHLISAFDGEEM